MSEVTIPVRLSHLLHHSSVGSIVRGDKLLVSVKDTRFWYGKEHDPSPIQYVEQVRNMLGISEKLCPPPTAKVNDDGRIDGTWIPAVLFPQWMYCPSPSCRLLYNRPWQHRRSDTKWFCHRRSDSECRQPLEQVPWVMVHEEGYLADVPWHFIAHANQNRNAEPCRPDWETPYLRLVDEEIQREVVCRRCNARNELPDRFPFPSNTWQQPWMQEPPPSPPEEPAWILGINDVRVHTSGNSTALVIPPESRIRKGTVVDRIYCNTRWQRDLKEAKKGLQRKSVMGRIAQTCRCSINEIEKALQELEEGYPSSLYGQTIAGGDLLQEEYQALTRPLPDLSEDEDFVTEHHTKDWKFLGQNLEGKPRQVVEAVDRLIEVRRLKEIMVLRGFHRLIDGQNVRPDITGETDWLPALELHGEGIFFTLDEAVITIWEQQQTLQNRAEALDQRAASIRLPTLNSDVSPRFLLLHTLAHLLIRQFETEAGYPAASLKERIYCEAGSKPMAGILIYVAVPDEVGSLGGLGELAIPDRFLRFLVSAFEAATWCSLDPVCATHASRGPHLLNHAACHACVLIPEPSCLYGNVLLDRTFVKSDEKRDIHSLLDFTGRQA